MSHAHVMCHACLEAKTEIAQLKKVEDAARALVKASDSASSTSASRRRALISLRAALAGKEE